MVSKERIKELEAIDRKISIRRKATTAIFVVLSVALVMYAVRIERKINELSQSPAVVVYKEATTEGESSIGMQDYEPSYGTTDVVHLGADMTYNSPEAEDGTSADLSESSEADKEVTAEVTVPQSEKAADTEKGQTYYVTQYGKKYHKSGCSYLSDSKRAVTAAEIADGGYTPCSRCFK